jgi:hypothetical protein
MSFSRHHRREPIVAVVVLQTDDPRLDLAHLDVSTAAAAASVRQAVVDALPHLTRVVSVMPESEGRLMVRAHYAVMLEIAGVKIDTPPPDYIAPEDRKH